ncbi:MAG: hypothetical protein B7Y45_06815 [Sphingomonas sp. 28-66-16]|nr:MAG: hypothetical protein B7Y45_06815 [Sphingomonas sp. 28-66-16]
MKSRAIMTLGLSALVMGGTVIGTAVTKGGIAIASTRSTAKMAKMAAAEAARAATALAAHKIGAAIDAAELAVRYDPQEASYRALLGHAYLQAGRFASARDAFGDALALSPSDGRVALSLALAQTATGDWTSARKTLDDHAQLVPVADLGLAMALAGDPASAVELLTSAARSPGADAKTRQNLALSLALAGRWEEARSVAALDVTPGDLDQRMTEWAAFAHPLTASAQVASLLGVTAVQDSGQPVALALNAPVSPQASSVDAYMPGQPAASAVPQVAASAAVEAAPVALAATTDVAALDTPATPVQPSITFADRREVVQALPTRDSAPGRAKPAVKLAVAKPEASPPAGKAPASGLAKGNFYVQLGAYENAGVARDGWMRATQRFADFADQTPSGMTIKTGGTSFYRLSVGGFARADAVSLCLRYRAAGGRCFVRASAGDEVASWKPVARQLASR